MVEPDKKRFAEILTATSELYGRTISVPAMRVWFAALLQYDIKDIVGAVQRHITSPDGKFMPVPADVIRIIEGSGQDAALLAWTKFTAALERVGTYQTVVFDDPIIHTVVEDMGGWVEFGATPIDEMRFRGIEFQRRYQAYRQRIGELQYPAKLIGITEADNRQRGYIEDIPAPLLIGDHEKARQVMLAGSSESRLKISTIGEAAVKLLAETIPLEGEKEKAA
jgi:hypothetical protein